MEDIKRACGMKDEREKEKQGHNGNNNNNNNNNNDDDDDEAVVEAEAVMSGRERLKRHREEVKGKVKIPEEWGHDKLLKDWIDYTTFDALMAPNTMILSARDALAADARKAAPPATPRRLRLHTSCSFY